MQSSWDQSVFLGSAAVRIGDRYVIGLERTAEGPFEIGFSLREIGKRAKFGATRGDQVALGQSCTLIISLSDPVADRYRHTQLNRIGRKIVVKNLARSLRVASVVGGN